MQRVIGINLNGNAYQIDEGGYAALVAYLETAERQLADNPDRAEIVADLEQAIADKCRGFLGPHKTVVAAAEVDRIIREMGPVDGGAGSAPSGGTDTDRPPAGAKPGAGAPRRLYLIHEGAMFGGVCNGIAAYAGVDVTIVRIVFLVLALITKGGFGLVYLALAFVIPSADTSEERAAARGQAFNAQELIDRAKKNYAEFKTRRDWRRRWRANRWRWSGSSWSAVPPPPPAGAYGARMTSGLLVPILTIAGVLFFWFWAWALFSLVTTRQVFGEPLTGDVPLWAGILLLVVLYHAIAWPLHVARRRAACYSRGGLYDDAAAAWGGVMSIGFAILIVWLAYLYLPEVRELLRTVPDVLDSFTR